MMPVGGGAARSRATATLNVITHDLEVAPEIGMLLAECAELELSAWQQANVRIIQRNFDRGNCLSSEFVREQTEAVMASEQAWRVSRATIQ